ncbi:methylenetetrahydrofolate reductase [NAD(P)H] [Cryomorphaceae bacterium 1068]|nr:methylenetetrahydrofolate reductase [NAD(P)H] [Cryomorphaceae bacterium 1068]
MKVTDHLKRAKSTVFSFEILPPLKGKGIEDIYRGIDPLMDFKPPFINVTYHREEYIYKKFPNDMLKKVSIRKRPGTVGICAAIINRYDIDAVPHLICGGFTKEETENALIDLHFLGVDNVLALRGDPIKSENNFVAEELGHQYAEELINQIARLNQGNYLHEESENSGKTNFCIGAAGYPEKHYESMSIKTDLKYLKEKVDAGAEYITTQMFFDNQKFFDFEKRCREMGITVPIIPGLKPITSLRHIQFLPKTFFIDFPDDLADQLMDCKTNDQVKKVGVEWAIKQSQGLVEHGVPCLHYYTMGKSEAVKEIASEVF